MTNGRYIVSNIHYESVTDYNGNIYSWLVKADSARFGSDAVMAQLPTLEQAKEWARCNLVDVKSWASADERIRQECDRHGKIQIGYWMYHNPYIDENGHVFGYSNSHGWQDITSYLKYCVMKSEDIGKTFIAEYDPHTNTIGTFRTVKFGNACAW